MQKEFDWFDKSDNLKKLRMWSYVLLAASVVAEFFVRGHGAEHRWDKIPGFYAIFGFVTCVLMIFLSKFLGQFWLKKSEDYYDK